MNAKSTERVRLCPQCANSIDQEAPECPYCKADLFSQSVFQWLKRDESPSEPRISSGHHRSFPIPAKFLWLAGMLVVALFAFFAGGYMQRSRLLDATQATQKQLQAKDQMIQSQEAQLAKFRQQLNESANQLAEMKTKLEESQKDISATKQQLAVATREADRLSANRSVAARRTASRVPDASAPMPAPPRGTAQPGVYETTRATAVYEGPSSTSRVISQIGSGTRINVVSSSGDWLEVRSRHGNPPGYVRSDDARLIARAN